MALDGAAKVKDVTTASFKADVIAASVKQPVLVDFWAPWCAPCRMLAPTIDKIAERFAGKVKVGKINIDDNQDVAVRYGISAIPQLFPLPRERHRLHSPQHARDLRQRAISHISPRHHAHHQRRRQNKRCARNQQSPIDLKEVHRECDSSFQRGPAVMRDESCEGSEVPSQHGSQNRTPFKPART